MSIAKQDNKKAIIQFKGGLGNQMFQYAVYRKFQYLGYDVSANLNAYANAPYRTF